MAAIEPESTTLIIGRMLTPAFMVNAAALLLLSLHNKFSTLLSRIRALNTERRSVESGQDPAKAERKANLSRQIERLAKRLKYVRRAILFHYTGIALFLLTSFLIVLNMLLKHAIIAVADVVVFTLGMVSVFVGTLSHLRDVRTGFDAIRLEAPDAFEW